MIHWLSKDYASVYTSSHVGIILFIQLITIPKKNSLAGTWPEQTLHPCWHLLENVSLTKKGESITYSSLHLSPKTTDFYDFPKIFHPVPMKFLSWFNLNKSQHLILLNKSLKIKFRSKLTEKLTIEKLLLRLLI